MGFLVKSLNLPSHLGHSELTVSKLTSPVYSIAQAEQQSSNEPELSKSQGGSRRIVEIANSIDDVFI